MNPLAAQPRITRQPLSQSVSLGAKVIFQVSVASSSPLSFQWIKDNTNLPAATNRTFEIGAARPSDAGEYLVTLADTNGAIIQSSPAFLKVDTAFTKITSGRIVEDQEIWEGAAWGDFNNDGHWDLFVTRIGAGSKNALYQNKGDGTFTRITTGILASDGGVSSHGCAWADYDNDGDLDLYVSNIGPPNWLYRNDGDGNFTKLTSAATGPIVREEGNSIGHAWGDFDRDGFLDLFVPNGGIVLHQRDFLYRNLGDGSFAKSLAAPVATDLFISNQGAWSDYDNDGDLDLYVTHHGNARNSLYRNNGNGTFQSLTNDPAVTVIGNSTGAAWGDYDNDGDQDLFVSNWRSSPNTRNFLYRNKGDGSFETVTEKNVVTDPGKFFSCSWADYDNDGWLDLFATTDNQPRALYHNNQDGSFTRAIDGSLVNDVTGSVGCAWGDYDNDGFLDLFVANGAFGPAQVNSLYRNNGNSNSWLKVQCVGTRSNRSGIGAKIRVKAMIGGTERWQLREISGGSGYLSQNSLIASFGLGDANVVETLRIEWPSGLAQEMHDVPVKQALVVVEPFRVDLGSPGSQGLVELQINAGKGRAFQVEGSLDLISWRPLGLATNTAGMLRVADPEAEGRPQRFYRVRMP